MGHECGFGRSLADHSASMGNNAADLYLNKGISDHDSRSGFPISIDIMLMMKRISPGAFLPFSPRLSRNGSSLAERKFGSYPQKLPHEAGCVQLARFD